MLNLLSLFLACASIYGVLFACAIGVDRLAKMHRDCDPFEVQ